MFYTWHQSKQRESVCVCRYFNALFIRHNPVFTQVYIESDKVKIVSLWEAIRLVSKIPESKPNDQDQVYTVKELSIKAKQNGWGPIVVFAEVKYSECSFLLLDIYVLYSF